VARDVTTGLVRGDASLQAALAHAIEAVDLGWLQERRWFAGKHRSVAGVELADAVVPPGALGGVVALVDVAFADGGTEVYVFPVRIRAGVAVECAVDDPLWPALARVAGLTEAESSGGARSLASDLSNTAVVLGERAVLKLYRRPRPGRHPEAELLEALDGSSFTPGFLGALEHEGATLLVAQELVHGEPVAWEGLISRLAAGDRCAGEPAEAARVTAAAHGRLAATCRTRAGSMDDAAAARSLAERRLAEAVALDPVAARLERPARETLSGLDRVEEAPLQRIHGDLHVGQLLRTVDGLVIVDWEGNPDLPLEERSRLESPLRDLASLLLSFDHAARAAHRRNPGFDWRGWATEARVAALRAYEEATQPVDRVLLRALEVDKELAELAYAARFVPEWLYAPEAVFPTVLDDS
jgi:maltokinase